jgi:hypothetical protein
MASLMIENSLKMKNFKPKLTAVNTASKRASVAKTLVGAAVIAVGVFGAGLQAYGAPQTPGQKVKPQITIVLPSTLKPVSVGNSAAQEDGRIFLPFSIPIQNGFFTGLKLPAPSASINNINYSDIIAYFLSSLQGSVFTPLLYKSTITTIPIPSDPAGNLIVPVQPQGPIKPEPEDLTLETRDAASVPGPLPLLGLASAFGCSRRLRQRISTRGQN